MHAEGRLNLRGTLSYRRKYELAVELGTRGATLTAAIRAARRHLHVPKYCRGYRYDEAP